MSSYGSFIIFLVFVVEILFHLRLVEMKPIDPFTKIVNDQNIIFTKWLKVKF